MASSRKLQPVMLAQADYSWAGKRAWTLLRRFCVNRTPPPTVH